MGFLLLSLFSQAQRGFQLQNIPQLKDLYHGELGLPSELAIIREMDLLLAPNSFPAVHSMIRFDCKTGVRVCPKPQASEWNVQRGVKVSDLKNQLFEVSRFLGY